MRQFHFATENLLQFIESFDTLFIKIKLELLTSVAGFSNLILKNHYALALLWRKQSYLLIRELKYLHNQSRLH